MATFSTATSRDVLRQSQNHEMLPKAVPAKDTSPMSSQNKHSQQSSSKKVSRRSSKPIINWFQRKLGGSVKQKRFTEGKQPGIDSDAGRGRGSNAIRQSNRIASSPLPIPSSRRSSGKQQNKLDQNRRKAVSLSGEDDLRDRATVPREEDDQSLYGSSLARESTWSPTPEADEDASVRPLPPSTPPSPSPSPSSSSYLSNPHTFRSMAASTKPTTVLSIDLAPNGVAHIAQVPGTPLSHVPRFPPHVRTSSTNTNPGLLGSGTSVTFSALPPSPQSSSRSPSLRLPVNVTSSTQRTAQQGHEPISTVQAPLHTTHHPRNNPRPSSPPLDNASVLTLASSAFAFSGSRIAMPGWSSTPSALGGSDSVSHFGGGAYADAESTSQFVLGDDERLEERDGNASVRALRPRSSRRGSWYSETSDWSAQLQAGVTPSPVRERSLWTSNTDGQFSVENDEMNRRSDDCNAVDSSDAVSQCECQSPQPDIPEVDENKAEESELPTSPETIEVPEPSAETPYVPSRALPFLEADQHVRSTDAVARLDDTKEQPAMSAGASKAQDDESLASNDQELWHSAPSTPLDMI